MISYAVGLLIDKMKIFFENRNKSLIFLKKYDILILQVLFAFIEWFEKNGKTEWQRLFFMP